MPDRNYQLEVQAALSRIYDDVKVQWYPFRGEGRHIYSPAIDIAVGPFATEERLEAQYTQLLQASRNLVDLFLAAHNANVEDNQERTTFDSVLHFNENARSLSD